MSHQSDDVTADARARGEERGDVTGRAKERLRESEERFRAIVNQATAGICQTDLAGRFAFVNDRYCEIVGRPREELLATRMQDITHEEDLPRNLELFGRMVESGEPFVIEKRYVRPEGSEAWVSNSVSLLRDAAGEPRGTLAVTLDITDRKRAAEALRESEERYRAFVGQSSEAVWRFEVEVPMPTALAVEEQIEHLYRHAYLAECNDVMARQYGYDHADEITGMRLGDLMPRQEEANLAYLRAFLAAGYRLTDAESHEVDRAGRPRYFLNNLIGIVEGEGKGGRLRRAWGTQRDITERKRAEEALRESRRKLETALRAGRMGSWSLDLTTGELAASDACKINYGRRPGEEFTYQDLADSIHPDDLAMWRAKVDRAVAAAAEFEIEYRTRWPDGSLHWVLVRGNCATDEAGRTVALAGVSLDITERREVEQALRESEEKYRTVFNSIDEGFCVVEVLLDDRGRPRDYLFLEINPAFARLTGLENAVGKTALEMIPGLESLWVETYGRVALTGEAVRFENYAAPMNSWFDVYASRVGGGESRRVAIVFTNITERKRIGESERLAAARDAFRVALADALRPLSDPAEIQATANRVLGEHLGASRALYAEVEPDGEGILIAHDYVNGVPSLVGRLRLGDFGATLRSELHAGRTVVVSDAPADAALTDQQRAAYTAVGVVAHVAVPLVKEGRLVAAFAVHQAAPRAWTPDEVALIEETAERTWAAVERARAEEVVRESEENLQAALEGGRMGAWSWDPATNTGARDRRVLQLFGVDPDNTAGDSAPIFERVHPDDLPGVMAALEAAQQPGGEYRAEFRVRWADGQTRWLAGAGRARFDERGRATLVYGVNFDITERKQAESDARFLADLAERLRLGEDAGQLLADACELTGRYLQLNRCFFAEVDEARDCWRVTRDYHAGVPPLAGEYRLSDYPDYALDDMRAGRMLIAADTLTDPRSAAVHETAYGPLGVRAYIVAPMMRDGAPVGTLNAAVGQPRRWQPREITLLETVAERVWNAVERLRADAALRDTQQLNEDVLDSLSAHISVLDKDGTITLVNESWRKFAVENGADWTTKGVGVGTNYLNVCHAAGGANSDEAAAIYHGLRAILDGARDSFSLEYPCHSPTARRWFLLTAAPLSGAGGGAVVSHFNITERRQAEELRRESEERYRLMTENARDYAIIFLDTEARVKTWSAGAERILGWKEEEVLGHPGHIIFTSEDRAGGVPEKELRTAAAEGRASDERWHVRKDGSRFFGSGEMIGLFDEAGELRGFAKIFRDLTERRRAEEERERMFESEQAARRAAEEASRLKDEFLATVSHELRTPLTAVIGWTHLLRAGKLDGDGAARALETVERNARAQNQLIEDLLDISRIITGKLRLDVKPLDPIRFIESAVEAVLPAAAAKGVRLRKVLDTGAGAISGDADRLQQVVWNLLSNAIKFTPKGGRVLLRLERINSHVEIVVTDTGAGIGREFLPFVFDRFRQADGSTTRAHGGLGLGLAIVRHLVELHGGTVSADSPGEGGGSTFTIKLPQVPVHQRAGAEEERMPPRAGSPPPPIESDERLVGVRLLVVDDEADTGEMLRAILTERGAEVTVARSAEEALAEIKRSPFDLLISDIGMPGADGYELLGRVRNLPADGGGRLPAVALTAYARTEDRLRALRAGYQMHVPKPVEADELIAVVSSLVAR